MPVLSTFCGIVLIAIGVAGYFYGRSSGAASMTALIPAAFGVVLALCGLLAGIKEGLRKHAMHLAAAIALIGFILTAGRMMMRVSQLTLSPAVISQLATAIVCLIFVLAAIGSFSAARRNSQI